MFLNIIGKYRLQHGAVIFGSVLLYNSVMTFGAGLRIHFRKFFRRIKFFKKELNCKKKKASGGSWPEVEVEVEPARTDPEKDRDARARGRSVRSGPTVAVRGQSSSAVFHAVTPGAQDETGRQQCEPRAQLGIREPNIIV